MIRVFVADDHAIVRDGLRRLIEETPGMELAGETSRGRAVIERAGDGSWDVLVLDLSLEDVGGV
ncbi:response regulator, partial [Klebsiella pneumoniae]|nr:response regulator [Klebsiella pneumoniae]